MYWIKIKHGDYSTLPKHRQAVLVRYNRDNWLVEHTLSDHKNRHNWRWQAAIFLMGKTNAECIKAGVYKEEDQCFNNKYPYGWNQFGPGYLFSQDVSHWMAIDATDCD